VGTFLSTEKSTCGGGDGGGESDLIGLGPVETFLRTEKTTCGGESELIGFGPVGTFRSCAEPIGGGGGGSDVMGSGPRGTFRSTGKCSIVTGGGGESDVMGSGPPGTFLSTANCTVDGGMWRADAVEGSISIRGSSSRSADDATLLWTAAMAAMILAS
jgi:hypothetical protein